MDQFGVGGRAMDQMRIMQASVPSEGAEDIGSGIEVVTQEDAAASVAAAVDGGFTFLNVRFTSAQTEARARMAPRACASVCICCVFSYSFTLAN